jgi:hypothetical protein
MMRLTADPGSLRETFRAARPFPHIVIDRLFPDDELRRLAADCPSPSAAGWRRFDNANERKLGYFHESSDITPATRAFLEAMNGFETLLFLEALTGIEGLIPDPYFGGGGLHQIERGGFLKIHADFNVHPKLRIDRRLNMLIYLNEDWREEYGGHLELWDADLTACQQRILPIFNRTVVFATDDSSFHGHPQPLACPPSMTRKSLSLYYYTAGGAAEPAHDTRFVDAG